jgi:Effector-associated domain 1/Ubiquitin-conjugating enzyme
MAERPLPPADRVAFRDELARIYPDELRLHGVLADIGYPAATLPPGMAVRDQWSRVIDDLMNGAEPGIPALLEYVLTPGTNRYPRNDVLRRIAATYAPGLLRQEQSGAGTDQPAPASMSQLFVRIESEDERQRIVKLLRARGLDPELADATNVVTRFQLGPDDAAATRRALEGISNLSWTVVPPGGPAYLLSNLIVEGPDGRSFLFTDTPAATTIADVAADALAEYPDAAGTPRSAVADRVEANGQGTRLNPEENLDQAGIRDGDRLRVGYQANAGAVNPVHRNEALFRAGNQIEAFIDNHPGIGLDANAPDLATWYELQFVQRSFGPPRDLRALDPQPTEIDEHVVQIELGPDFPDKPPQVYWQTEIFHPNIWPNYESDNARQHPLMRGLVCLGELTESTERALEFSRLCQTLLDIAAYRNYSVLALTGGVTIDEDGRPREAYKGNVFDQQAGLWAFRHPDVIKAMGGTPEFAFRAEQGRTYRNHVEDFRP